MKTLLILIAGFGLAFASYAGTTNDTASAELLPMRSYEISSKTFASHLKHLVPPQSGESDQALLLRYFKQHQIELQEPSHVFLDEREIYGKKGKGKLTIVAANDVQNKIFVQLHIDKIVPDNWR